MKTKLATVVGINIVTAALVAVVAIQPSFLFKNDDAHAAGGYTAKWEQTKCRAATIPFGNVSAGSPSTLNIGPAEWKVTYTTTSGQKIVETWTAASWKDSAGATGLTFSSELSSSTACATYAGGATKPDFQTIGQYSATSSSLGKSGFAFSMPTGWNVSGTVQ